MAILNPMASDAIAINLLECDAATLNPLQGDAVSLYFDVITDVVIS